MTDHSDRAFALVVIALIVMGLLAANDDRPPSDPTGLCNRPSAAMGC